MCANSLRIVARQSSLDQAIHVSEVVHAQNLPAQLETMRRALLVSEVAALFKISQRQVYKLAAEHQIPSMKIAGCIRFDGVVLAAWLRMSCGGAR